MGGGRGRMGGRGKRRMRRQQLLQQQQEAQEEMSWEALLHSISQLACCCICGERGHFPVNCPLPEDWDYSCWRGDKREESVRPAPDFAWGRQGSCFAWGRQGSCFAWGRQGSCFAWGRQGSCFAWGRQGSCFAWGRQGSCFAWGRQGSCFAWGRQGSCFAWGRQGSCFAWGRQGSCFAWGRQGSCFAWGRQGSCFAWGRQGSCFAWGRQGSCFAWGRQGSCFAWGRQGSCFAWGRQGSCFAWGRQGSCFAWGRQGSCFAWGRQGSCFAWGRQGSCFAWGRQGSCFAWGRQGSCFAWGRQGSCFAWGRQGSCFAWGRQGSCFAWGRYTMAGAPGKGAARNEERGGGQETSYPSRTFVADHVVEAPRRGTAGHEEGGEVRRPAPPATLSRQDRVWWEPRKRELPATKNGGVPEIPQWPPPETTCFPLFRDFETDGGGGRWGHVCFAQGGGYVTGSENWFGLKNTHKGPQLARLVKAQPRGAQGPRQRDVSANQGFNEHPLQKSQTLGTPGYLTAGAARGVPLLPAEEGLLSAEPAVSEEEAGPFHFLPGGGASTFYSITQVSPFSQLRKASSVQSLQFLKRKPDRSISYLVGEPAPFIPSLRRGHMLMGDCPGCGLEDRDFVELGRRCLPAPGDSGRD
ncbi:UNVERIFIED_CONTAM: hypothetical protein FKN15_037400 [Acipenser sinensis]